jgi:NAD-dependent DNA ligase
LLNINDAICKLCQLNLLRRINLPTNLTSVDVLQLPKKTEVEENKRVRVRGEIYRQQYAHLDLNSSANLTGL